MKPGDDILDVVPQGDNLIIETQVKPLDIDSVHAGLVAEIRLTPCKQRRTPTVFGTVLNVSADALANPTTGEAYFAARVQIDPAALERLDGVKLYPGKPTEVMIITDHRTALQYLLDPVRDSFHRAFREK